jgi:hypothetical protein
MSFASLRPTLPFAERGETTDLGLRLVDMLVFECRRVADNQRQMVVGGDRTGSHRPKLREDQIP